MSGIQNIKKLAKRYNKAIIYFHMDLDGVTSALAMKEYLSNYGIETISAQRIQYGNMEYSISKPLSEDVLPVLVDFSHGKVFIKIHTDHHDNQIAYNNSSKNFRHSLSNVETISSLISPIDIFSYEDVRIINMIDSAEFKRESVEPSDITNAIFEINENETVWKNHLTMGMVTGKLLLTYKNKANFLETIVMNSMSSLQSMYNTIIKIIKEHVNNNESGWVLPEEIQQNSHLYFMQQSERKITDGKIDDIITLNNGTALKIGDCVFQIGSGYTKKAGMYDRYTVFRLYPNVKYMVMLWDSLGLIQVSKNPWDINKSDINLGELVINNIFKNKFAKFLYAPKYRISVLALKKYYESSINEDNEESAIGFDFNELMSVFNQNYDKLSSKQQYVIKKWMDWKPSDYNKVECNNIYDEKHNNEIDRAIEYLNKITIPLADIVKTLSGGHPSITNLTGFQFIEVQKMINKMIQNDKNPMGLKQTVKDVKHIDDNHFKYDTTSVKIMKSICKDVIEYLNKKEV